jgi:predicted NBD/HSP70 family sugar kinase
MATAWINRQIQQLMAQNSISWDKCVGIGISSPGPLDYQKGIILKPPNFKLFANYPIVESLRSQLKLNIPIMLENNSVLLAITDYQRNSLENFSQIMFITIWEGIGTAILSHGEIMRGYAGFTGELGHSSIDYKGIQCSCGNQGCLEQYVSFAALQKRFKFKNYKKMVDRAYNNEPRALKILSFMANYLGCAIANAVNMLDLDAIVLHGEFNYRPVLLMELIMGVVHSRSVVCRSHLISFLVSGLNQDDIDIANAAGVINNFFAHIT